MLQDYLALLTQRTLQVCYSALVAVQLCLQLLSYLNKTDSRITEGNVKNKSLILFTVNNSSSNLP